MKVLLCLLISLLSLNAELIKYFYLEVGEEYPKKINVVCIDGYIWLEYSGMSKYSLSQMMKNRLSVNGAVSVAVECIEYKKQIK